MPASTLGARAGEAPPGLAGEQWPAPHDVLGREEGWRKGSELLIHSVNNLGKQGGFLQEQGAGEPL